MHKEYICSVCGAPVGWIQYWNQKELALYHLNDKDWEYCKEINPNKCSLSYDLIEVVEETQLSFRQIMVTVGRTSTIGPKT